MLVGIWVTLGTCSSPKQKCVHLSHRDVCLPTQTCVRIQHRKVFTTHISVGRQTQIRVERGEHSEQVAGAKPPSLP